MILLVFTWMLGTQVFFLLAQDEVQLGVEFSIDEWESSKHFNTTDSVLIYHYRKMSGTERNYAVNRHELRQLSKICFKHYGSRLVNWHDLNDPHFISVVSSLIFQPYKFSEMRAIMLDHGFFVNSITGSKAVFWICRENRYLVDFWTKNHTKWKGSRGCSGQNTEDLEPPDLFCVEVRPHFKPTTTVLLPVSSTSTPPTEKRPKDCPSGSHLVAGLSDSPWDVFLIQNRYGLLTGTVLCALALLVLGCFVLMLVRRSRRLRKQRNRTMAGVNQIPSHHATSPSRTPMLCHSTEYCKCNNCHNSAVDPTTYHSGSIVSASHGYHLSSPERDDVASCHYQAAQCRSSHFSSSSSAAHLPHSRSSSIQRSLNQGMLVQGQI